MPIVVLLAGGIWFWDGKMRFRKIRNSKILKTKLIYAVALFIVSLGIAVIVWPDGLVFRVLVLVLAAGTVVCSIFLGLLGMSLDDAAFPGKSRARPSLYRPSRTRISGRSGLHTQWKPRHHEINLVSNTCQHLIRFAEQITIHTPQLVVRDETQPNLVGDQYEVGNAVLCAANESFYLLHRCLLCAGFINVCPIRTQELADGVVDQERNTVHQHQMTRSRFALDADTDIQGRLKSAPSGRSGIAMRLDSPSHLIVACLRGGNE